MTKYPEQKAYLGNVLRRIMRDRQLNQVELARLGGIGEDVLSTWLSGRSMASMKMLKKFAGRLDMPVDAFLMPDEPVKPTSMHHGVKAEMISPGVMRLEINAEVPFETATKIMALLNS